MTEPRMPVILDPHDYDQWLDPRAHDPGALLELLRPYGGAMASLAVGTQVNSAKHDSPDCIEPAGPMPPPFPLFS